MKQLCKILIVDDEYLLRQGIKHLIDWEKEGFEIVGEASNGKEALNLIEKFRPHIVLLDIVMPVMDGIDLTKILKTKYPEIQIIILSSYSNFNYVKDTLKFGVTDYVLKPTINPDNLLEILKKSAKNIPDFVLSTDEDTKTFDINAFLYKLINNSDTNIKLSTIKNYLPYDSFCIIGDNIKKIANKNSMNISLLKTILSETAKKSLNGLTYYEIELSSNSFLILLNFNKNDFQKVLNHIKEMVSNVSNEITDIFFIQSKIFNSIYDLNKIYTQNYIPMFEYKFYFKGKKLLSFDELPENNFKDKFDFKYYSDQIYLLNIDNALNYLKNFITLSIKNCSINEFELKTLLENAVYNLINILDELDFNMEDINNSKIYLFKKIDEAAFSDELLLVMDDIYMKINKLISASKDTLNKHTINKILEYISEHYNEQLSLKQLADIFHFNYYYLSSYFSSCNNSEGFSEYLNKIRIEKAVGLLHDEKIPVSEISYMVGYSDQSYFCKVFKKFKKCTPTEFKKNIINKKK